MSKNIETPDIKAFCDKGAFFVSSATLSGAARSAMKVYFIATKEDSYFLGLCREAKIPIVDYMIRFLWIDDATAVKSELTQVLAHCLGCKPEDVATELDKNNNAELVTGSIMFPGYIMNEWADVCERFARTPSYIRLVK